MQHFGTHIYKEGAQFICMKMYAEHQLEVKIISPYLVRCFVCYIRIFSKSYGCYVHFRSTLKLSKVHMSRQFVSLYFVKLVNAA